MVVQKVGGGGYIDCIILVYFLYIYDIHYKQQYAQTHTRHNILHITVTEHTTKRERGGGGGGGVRRTWVGCVHFAISEAKQDDVDRRERRRQG